MPRHRFDRPTVLPPLALTERDRRALEAVDEFGYLTGRHLQALVFLGVSPRVAQDRLRRLWAHGLLDRLFPVGLAPRTSGERLNLREPTYTATKKGKVVLGRTSPHGRQMPGLSQLQHHLVAASLLVAIKVAAPGAAVLPEAGLRRLVRNAPRGVRPLLVPDGAITLDYHGAAVTYLVEVVRAPAKRGNASLLAKMLLYRDRLRTNWFAVTYGLESVRAVLFLAPTEARAEHYQALARDLSPGRGLFWFGAYEAEPTVGPPHTRFEPETILDVPFEDGAGRRFTFRNPLTPSHV